MPLQIQPLGLLEVLGQAFSLLTRRFPTLLAIAAVFNVPLQLAIDASYRGAAPFLEAATSMSATPFDAEAVPGLLPVSVVAVVFLVALAGLPWSQLALTHAITETAMERDWTFDRVYRETISHYGTYAISLFLASLGVIAGLCLLILPGIYVGILWAAIAPVVVIEGTGGARALGRSRELVGGSWWHVFGVLVVAALAGAIAGGVLEFVLGFVSPLVPGFAPLLGAVVSSATVAFYSAVSVVLYFDLRARGGEGDARPGADEVPGGAGRLQLPNSTSTSTSPSSRS